MTKHLLAAALLSAALVPTSFAAGKADCRGPFRAPTGRLVAVGDSEGHVFSQMGRPSREVQLENRFGAGLGVRWVYYIDGNNPKTVTFDMAGSQVQRICQLRN